MDGRFFTNCVRNIIEKAVSICVIIPQNRKVKKLQLHIIDQSFEHNGMGIIYQKKLESLEEKKAVHPSRKHGVRRICQPYPKGGPAGKLTWCEPPGDHLDYRRRDNSQRSSPKNIGRAIACVAGVSVRFRSKERGTRVKDCAKNGSCFISRAAKTKNPVPRSFFAPKPNGNACYAG